MNYIGFDLEIAKTIPEDASDLWGYAPLGISCAAIATGRGTEYWYDIPRMTQRQCQGMVNYLLALVDLGHTLVTWNGAGFDFRVLAQESGMWRECRKLALNHIDMMFHFFCMTGYALGLDKAARGMGLAGKVEGMNGAKAPEMWAAGKHREVLEYLGQDTQVTYDLACAIEQAGCLRWVSNSSRQCEVDFPQGLLPVRQALALPEPDTSWMTREPWERSKFVGWIDVAGS